MENRWFLISKVSMSEGAYTALLVSNIIHIPGMEYSDDPFIVHVLNTVMPKQQDIYNDTFVSFFASNIAESRTKGRKSTYHIRYEQHSQQLECLCSLDNPTLTEVVRYTMAFLSAVKFKNIDTTDFFIAAEGDPNNITLAAEIGIKTTRFTVPEPRFSLPRDLIGLLNSAFSPHSPKFMQERSLFDKDIAEEFERIVKQLMSQGRESIIQKASPENPLVITDDLHYRTDGKNVITMDGTKVTGAHLTSFTSLQNGYAKDDWEIYYGTQRVNGADVDSFKVLSWEYAKDKFAAYYRGEKIARIVTNFKTFRPAYGYAADGETVYYCGKPITGSDPASFYAAGESELNGGIYFGADRYSIYFNGVKIPYIDAASFVHIGNNFFKDAINVYVCDKIIAGCCPDSVQVINRYYVADEKSLFFCMENEIVKIERTNNHSEIRTQGVIAVDNEYVYYKGAHIQDADGKTAQITDSFNDGYIVDSKNVFYFNEKLAASCGKFVPLGFGYAHDGKSVFFGDKLISGADAASFRAISYSNAFDKNAKYCFGKKVIKFASPDIINIGGKYYKEDKYVYYLESLIESADYSSFETMAVNSIWQDYAKDAKQVYFKGKIIKGADSPSFVLLPPHPHDINNITQIYAKDSKNIYFEGIKVHTAMHSEFKPFDVQQAWTDSEKIFIDGKELQYIDVPTLTDLGNGFYCDVNSVYFGVTRLENLLPDSVMVLDDNYIRDDMYIYYAEELPDGAIITNQFSVDYNTFDVLHNNKAFAFDKNHIFFRGTPIADLDFNKINMIGNNYITDGIAIFCGDVKLVGVDVETFTLLGEGYAADKTQAYYQSMPLRTESMPHILGSGYATDGKQFWHYGKIVNNPSENQFLKNILGDILS